MQSSSGTKPKGKLDYTTEAAHFACNYSLCTEESYEARVRRYCDANQVVTPIALGRRKVARFAVVDVKAQPNQLIALTFSRASDLVTYLRRSETDWPQRPLHRYAFSICRKAARWLTPAAGGSALVRPFATTHEGGNELE